MPNMLITTAALLTMLLTCLSVVALIIAMRPTWQRMTRGWADKDADRVHKKLIEAREQQKPFHMTVYEVNALRATTNDFHDEVTESPGPTLDREGVEAYDYHDPK